jgi:hypothetical protein
MTPKTKPKRGRPAKGLDRVLYIRISEPMAQGLADLCAAKERETGFPVSTSDMIRKLIADVAAVKSR